jgi:hypothetical protein
MKMLNYSAIAFLAMATAFTARSATTADLVFVVDESGSMAGEHAWLGSMVSTLDTNLITAGVTGNRYGLVGFGSGIGGNLGADNLGRTLLVGGSSFGTAAAFATAAGSLRTSGGFEDGYSGLNFAQNYSFREGAAINFILVTDEDRDNGNALLTYSSMLSSLTGQGALLNAVVNGTFRTASGVTGLGHDSDGNVYSADGFGGFGSSSPLGTAVGAGTTIANYYNLALATGGAAWSLNELRAGGLKAESFTKAFVSVKVTEIATTPTTRVPDAGSTVLLLMVGIGALIGVRRRLHV